MTSVLEAVVRAVSALEGSMADFEPGTLSGDGAAQLMEVFAKGERLCAVGKALCARRATEASAHRRAARTVAEAVSANPAAEAELVRSAKAEPMGAFRERAARARARGAQRSG
ncbi:MAG: hypothetical protein ACRDY2_07015 [Acidimicrobiales bacterium]